MTKNHQYEADFMTWRNIGNPCSLFAQWQCKQQRSQRECRLHQQQLNVSWDFLFKSYCNQNYASYYVKMSKINNIAKLKIIYLTKNNCVYWFYFLSLLMTLHAAFNKVTYYVERLHSGVDIIPLQLI